MKMNEAGSEEIEWGLGQEFRNLLLWLLNQIIKQYQTITICNSTYDFNVFFLFCVCVCVCLCSFLDGTEQIGYRECYSAFTETGATQTMKTNQMAEPKQ